MEACTFSVRVFVSALPLRGKSPGQHSSPHCWKHGLASPLPAVAFTAPPPPPSPPRPGLRVFWVELLHDSLGSNAAHKPDRWTLGEPVPPLWPCGPSWRNIPHRGKDTVSWAPRLRLPFWKGHGVLCKTCCSCRIASRLLAAVEAQPWGHQKILGCCGHVGSQLVGALADLWGTVSLSPGMEDEHQLGAAPCGSLQLVLREDGGLENGSSHLLLVGWLCRVPVPPACALCCHGSGDAHCSRKEHGESHVPALVLQCHWSHSLYPA